MTNDKQRDRLVELLDDAEYKNLDYGMANKFYPFDDYKSHSEFVADYLLENGGLFPPLKIGQEIWDIHYNKPRKWKVVYLGYNGKEWHFNIHWWKDKHNFKTMSIIYPFVGKMWYLTKEEAEKALGGVQG